MDKKEYIINASYTFVEQVEVEANSQEEAIILAKEKLGRKESEYEKVEYEIEESFF